MQTYIFVYTRVLCNHKIRNHNVYTKDLQDKGKNNSKNIIEFILYWPSPDGLGICLQEWIAQKVTLLEKTNISFVSSYQMEIHSGLGMWPCIHIHCCYWALHHE